MPPEQITLFPADSCDNFNLASGKERVHKCVSVVRRREITWSELEAV